jgi:ankyrin repeat protein
MQIHSAAKRGDLEAVRYCLQRGVPVDQIDAYDRTALLAALGARWTASPSAILEIARTLLAPGADPNARDDSRRSPLALAVRNGSCEQMQLLLQHGADPNAVDEYGGTALHGAVSNQSLPQVQLLVEHGADSNLQTSETGLIACLLRWDDNLKEIRDYLLAHGMRGEAIDAAIPIEEVLNSRNYSVLKRALDAQSEVRPKGWNAVHETLIRGTAADLRALAIDSADLRQPAARYDYPPFLLAVAMGDPAKAEALLELGASLREEGWFGRSAFDVAIESGQAQMVRWLIERGLPVDFSHREGDSPLMGACEMNCVEAVEILLQHGASATEQGEYGRPIHKAASLEVTRLLVERGGAEINEVDSCGYWPLRSAAFAGDFAWVKWLLDHGAQIDLTSTGETALHSAVFVDALDVTRLLLEHGANPNARDVDDDTPLHQVRSREMVQLLRSFGADPNNYTSMSGPPQKHVEDPLIQELL